MDKIQSLQKSSQYNNSRKKTIEGFMSKGGMAAIVICSIIGGIIVLYILMKGISG
jgi:hypothetical protein